MNGTAENGAARPALTEPFEIGGVRLANRVLLAPLAGIGNWFVRLQAKRHGAGLAVSEMVSIVHSGSRLCVGQLCVSSVASLRPPRLS